MAPIPFIGSYGCVGRESNPGSLDELTSPYAVVTTTIRLRSTGVRLLPTSCFHQLIPPPRDTSVTTRLRLTTSCQDPIYANKKVIKVRDVTC